MNRFSCLPKLCMSSLFLIALRVLNAVASYQDIISLVVQGGGGGIAASASDLDGANLGAKIMLGGIIFQLSEYQIASATRNTQVDFFMTVVIVVYSSLSTEFLFRYFYDRPLGSGVPANQSQTTLSSQEYRGEMDTKMEIMIGGLCFNILCLFIRCATFSSISRGGC